MITDLTRVVETIYGFAVPLMQERPRPSYSWSKTANGTISVVKLWQAHTIDENDRRDFRLVALMNDTNPPGEPWLHPVFWSGRHTSAPERGQMMGPRGAQR